MKDKKLTEAVKKTVAYLQQWTCNTCNILLPPTYQVDHVIPQAVLSDDSFDNLQALCPNCHSRKTQMEHMRIIRYKKKRALAKCQLCWFCLERVDESMTCCCDKTLKKMTFETKKMSLISEFDRFCHIAPDTVLNITLERDKIKVNNQEFCFQIEYDLGEIADSVFVATRTKKCSKYFTEVEVVIDFGGEPNTTLGLVDFLDAGLPSRLPARIFADPMVPYTYLIEGS